SRIPGTPALASSWLQTTCSIGPKPWPPYSFGQVTPASPASASLPCHARLAGDGSWPAQDGRLCLVLLEPGAHLSAMLCLLGRIVKIHVVSLWLTGQSMLVS